MIASFLGRQPRITLGRTGPLGLWPVALDRRTLAQHKHIIGTTGVGKSALMASLFVQLHSQGVGTCLVDPHADLATECLGALADRGYFDRPDAYQKLLYLDFRRRDRFLPFNVLAQPYPDEDLGDWLVEVCTRAWPTLGEGNAPTFENVVRHTVLLLCQNGRLPFTHFARVLTDRNYRDQLLTTPGVDPQVLRFFRDRMDQWGREGAMMKESSLNRADLLTYHPVLRYSLGQSANLLDFRAIMDGGISVIVNLGGLPEQVQRFLGAFICHGFEVAALSRENMPPEERRHYELIMDEASMFVSQTEAGLSRILSLCRKYSLFVTVAHQSLSQFSSRMTSALQNAITIGFRTGREDAEWAARRFGRFEETEVKHLVEDPHAVERTHPIFSSLPEQHERWVRAIEELGRGQAYVRSGSRTTKIRTRILPRVRASRDQIEAIAKRYAMTLMTPAAEVRTFVDGSGDHPVMRPTREPIPIWSREPLS